MAKKQKKYPSVNTTQSVSEAFATILVHNVHALVAWEKAAKSGKDIEGVHQVRVALRRMRSALTVFRPAIPRTVTDSWAQQMRQFASSLGPARDLDVFISEGLAPLTEHLPLPGAKPLMALAESHRAIAYDPVRTMLQSPEYHRFKKDFRDWMRTQGWRSARLAKGERERLDSPALTFAREVLNQRLRKVLKTGRDADQNSADEMHRLRIECKKLRYAVEFFLPLFEGMEDFVAHMKKLQDLLGVMHDVAVMPALIDGFLEAEDDRQAYRYAGVLIGWRAREYYDLKDSFRSRWEELAEAPVPWAESAAA
ncbi:MAG: CHAD domain-containing protein [Gammaproteobacteria bacterium]|jgi:CHAD domain-containing protein